MNESPIFYTEIKDATIVAAYVKAQETFPYFWRELSWEYRRMIPALQIACVKIAFTEPHNPNSELMWVHEIEFDGEFVSGVLANEPRELQNIKAGDTVRVPLAEVADWLFVLQGKSYGGFTIHALRSKMNEQERTEHDEAWGIDFGDFREILIAYQEKEHPENLEEHPMSKNMREEYEKFFTQNPEEINAQDEAGYTYLHREAIAGNRTTIEVLLRLGADKTLVTKSGKTAYDFAHSLYWEHIADLLR
jgi:uncharacterized protein YegJ (DUF2314 family)